MDSIYVKTKIYNGENSLQRLEQLSGEKIWIICDEFLIKSKKIDFVLKYIDKSNTISIFSEVLPDPPLNIIGKGIGLINKIKPTIIIGFGGGSAIDTAKGIIYFAKHKKIIENFKFIAIPTTSGTGSEVTSAAVITDTDEKIKHAIFDDDLLPDEAILDVNLTLTVPSEITANTGMDVLTHAIEAYVSKKSNVYSDALAEKAVELVISSLVRAYKNGNDIEARANMHEASNLAGMAFNIAGLGINHSLAHQLGGQFHIPHGLANAILLNKVIKFNCKDQYTLKKYAKLVFKTGMIEIGDNYEIAVEVLKKYITAIMKIMSMPLSLRECSVDKKGFEEVKSIMSSNALKDTCTLYNRKEVNVKDIETLFEIVY